MKSRLTQTFSTYAQLLSDYFYPEPTIFIGAKKKGRSRTSFGCNKTASIALPTEVSFSPPEKPTANYPLVDTFFNLVFHYFPSLKFPAALPATAMNSLPTGPLHEQIAALEKEYKTHRSNSDFAKIEEVNLKKIELVKEEIKEHAARRVDLFFYLMVAVYNQQVSVSKDSTQKQNGAGSQELGTQACHSSLFPHVALKKLSGNWQWLFNQASCPSFAGTHFEECLNMTVELPGIVNDFDGKLEGRYRPTKYMVAFLDILNRAAKAEIDVREGMNEFFKVMDNFFIETEKKYSGNRNKSKAFLKVCEYEKMGTFFAAEEDHQAVKRAYLELMLRVPKSLWLSSRMLQEACVKLQKEIYACELKVKVKEADGYQVINFK